MSRTALVLGANGRFGRHISGALNRHGWTVRHFNRQTDRLPDAAIGAELIVNAWNPPYARWKTEIPQLTQHVIQAAKAAGAAVLIPGNIYVYGDDLPAWIGSETPHLASNPLGQIRRQMEQSYRESGVKAVVLRAGDFLDTEVSGNWFDRIIASKIEGGKFSYPGPLDKAHLWAFLPDLAEAGARLVDHLDDMPAFSDVLFDGYCLTGAELAEAIEKATGRRLTSKRMSWWPIKLARPFWGEAKHILEMRYLWERPHGVRDSALTPMVANSPRTPLHAALAAACAPLLQNATSTQTRRWSDA